MKKPRLIKILEVGYVSDDDREVEFKREITLVESDLIRIYCKWKNVDIKDGMIIKNIIKIKLPVNNRLALKILNDGYIFNNKKYLPLITTPSFMKHEGIEVIGADVELEYKAEFLFILEEDKEFIKFIREFSSLGKIKEKYNSDIAINKDFVSRFALLTSTGIRVDLKYKYAILPEMLYSHVSNYLQFKETETGEIDLEKFELEEKRDFSVNFGAMDGAGFISPKLIEKVALELDVNYKLDFIGFRTVGTAGKGLLIRFDWKKYLKEEHGLSELIVKDFWGNDIDLFEVDVIFNSSQLKWAKFFNNAKEIELLKENYPVYREFLDGFNVIKINDKFQKEYTEMNYQVLSNLALSPKELDNLAETSKDMINKITNKDVASIRIALGDYSRYEKNELSPTTKLHELIQMSDGLKSYKEEGKEINPFLHSQFGDNIVESLINKKVHQLAGGRVLIKGNYKTIIKCPFNYFDSFINAKYVIDDISKKIIAVNGEIGLNGLKEHSNYVAGEMGKRVLARSPLNSATEILKTKLVENDMYSKYFGDFTKQIIFYSFDNFMMLQSGADEDLDTTLVINNEIVYGAVIEDKDENGVKWYYRNQFDGATKKTKFTPNNMYKEILESAGNSIGTYSNLGAVVSNNIQQLYYKKVEDGTEIKALIQDENGEIILNPILKDDDFRNFTIERFKKNKKWSYYLLFLQMVAIDSVKTGRSVSEAMEAKINWLKNKDKPIYLYHANWYKGASNKGFKNSLSLLCRFSSNINKELGYKMRKENRAGNEKLFKFLATFKCKNKELIFDIEQLYSNYRFEVGKKIAGESVNAKKLRLINIDLEVIEDVKKIQEEYESEDIIGALAKARAGYGNNKNISPRFIIQFFYNNLRECLLKLNNSIGSTYKIDPNGDIIFGFDKFIKVACNYTSNNLSEVETLEIHKRLNKLGLEKRLAIVEVKSRELGNFIIIKDDKVYNCNNDLIGNLYKDLVGTVDGRVEIKFADNREGNKSIGIYY